MLGQGKTTKKAQYCFNAEAVNEFFSKIIDVQDFAKEIRRYNLETSLVWLENPEIMPDNSAEIVRILNDFIEALDPYLDK